MSRSWSWTEDRQWATSRLRKNWHDKSALVLGWQLEVRTENVGVGSLRLGEIFLVGTFDGTLTIRISED